MAKVRVAVLGTVGKAVFINPAATDGATIGTNLRLPNGTVPSLEELAAIICEYCAGRPVGRVYWQDIFGIPRNIRQLARLDCCGIIVRVCDDEAGTSFTCREIRGAGIEVSPPPTITPPCLISLTEYSEPTTRTVHDFVLPEGIAEGELLLFIANTGCGLSTSELDDPDGDWNELFYARASTNTNAANIHFFWRVADGTEGGTTLTVNTAVSKAATANFLRYAPETFDPVAPFAAFKIPDLEGNIGTTIPFPEINLQGGNIEHQWIAIGAQANGLTDGIWHEPNGAYTSPGECDARSVLASALTGAGGTKLSVSTRVQDVVVDQPNSLQSPNEARWVSALVVLRPYPPYTYLILTESTTVNLPGDVYEVDLVLVGGGGGGEGTPPPAFTPVAAGGGGAGEVLLEYGVQVSPGDQVQVTIGAGGEGGTYLTDDLCIEGLLLPAQNGGDTIFGSYRTAAGGGRAGMRGVCIVNPSIAVQSLPASGGSGGGAPEGIPGAPAGPGRAFPGGTGTYGDGTTSARAGGGGGAAGPGNDGTSGVGINGQGGPGVDLNEAGFLQAVTAGAPSHVGGGGGGGTYRGSDEGADGGVGGGGKGGGGRSGGPGGDAAPGTGGGGGGAGLSDVSGPGGRGGSGLAVIRYLTGDWQNQNPQTGNPTAAGEAKRIIVDHGRGQANDVILDLAVVTQANAGELRAVVIDTWGRVIGNRAVTSADLESAIGGSFGVLPVVTGEVPPVLVYLDDGSLVYSGV